MLGFVNAMLRAARYLAKAPAFSFTIIGIVAVGIGVTSAIFALVDAVLIKPLPYRDPDRLVVVRHTASHAELPMQGLSSGTFLHYRANNHVFDDLAAYRESNYTILEPGEPERLRVATVTPSFFSVLRAHAHLGRFPTDQDFQFRVRAGVVLSYDLWVRRYGGDPDIVGRAVKIESNPATNIVVGVAEAGFHFPNPDTQVWLGESQEGRTPTPRAAIRGLFLNGIARLKPGVSLPTAEADLQRLIAEWPTVFPDVTAEQIGAIGFRATVRPLKQQVIGDVRVPLLLLLTTAAFLLLITWANSTNLSLVRAERLRRDVAVWRALGAGDRHLLERFFGEGAVLAAIGGLFGLAIAWGAIALRFGFDVDQIPRLREVGMDARVVGLVVALSVLSGVLMAAASFLSTRQGGLTSALTGAMTRVSGSRREQAGRRVLVIAQIASALPLLIGATLMVESFWRLLHVPIGFTADGAVTFTLPVPPRKVPSGDFYRDTARVHNEVLRGLRDLPGVTAVETATVFPLTVREGYSEERIVAAGRPGPDGGTFTLWSFATPGYFQAMGVPFLRGRPFQASDMSRESPGVILSAALASALFGNEDPIGKAVQRATNQSVGYTVVGVVGDVPADAIGASPSRILYFAHVYPPAATAVTGVITDYIPDTQAYVLRTRLPLATITPSIRRVVHDVDSRLVASRVSTVEQRVAASIARPRLTMLLLLAAAATALFLGVVGLYGVLAYAVTQRTREFGVRIALGASPAGVTWGVVRDGGVLALTGIAAGLFAAFALTRFLGTLLYQVSPADPLAFTAMAGLLLAVVIAASYVPARRAGRVEPILALKAE